MKILNYLNWQAVHVLVTYPLLLISGALYYHHTFGIKATEIYFILWAHYITNIAVGVGLHRLWAHQAFKTNKVIEFILVLFSAGALQGPILAWVSDHHKHHIHTDDIQDPHSPQRYSNKIKGFFWSHIGWMLVKDPNMAHKQITRATIVRLGRNKLVIWQLRHYWSLALSMVIVLPAMLGFIFKAHNVQGIMSGIIFFGLGRAVQQHLTFCTNSVCHLWGKQPYAENSARDVWWLGPMLIGENWHNFHHAFPADYRNGARWYHLDVHKWIIYLLSKLGLAWDLTRTSEQRIQVKLQEATNYMRENVINEWRKLREHCEVLKERVALKIKELETSSKLQAQMQDSYQYVNSTLTAIINEASSFLATPQQSSLPLLARARTTLLKLEEMMSSLLMEQNSTPT